MADPKQGPFAQRDGYVVVSPGSEDDSVMLMRITSDDPDVKMPPPTSNHRLEAAQIELIRQWIVQGAKWGKAWELVPPERPEIPAVNDRAWPRNPIDDFVLARLEKQGLHPSPEASREELIRRVTLDLTGLPPTPAEVEAFVSDPSAGAYEKVVDRLLASPRYGERMAWDWLDLARYADTNGYQGDPTRTMWPWRDWVVRAMNANMPFDQFATWQIAGDLIPNATEDERLASGFNRNHPYNGEGGRIPEETRVENVLDRVDTFGTAFLGLTVGCAKCHDHKYDPISQKEYYQLFAYFNQCSETGAGKYVSQGNVAPVMIYTTPQQAEQRTALQKAQKAAADRLSAAMPAIEAAEAKWAEQARYGKGWLIATPISAKSAAGATMKTLEDQSILVSGVNPDNDVHDIVLKSDLSHITALRIEALPDASLPHGGPGRSSDSGNFVLTSIEASATSLVDPAKTVKLAFSSADATYEQPNFAVGGAIDGNPKTGWAVYKAPDKNNLSAVFRFAQPIDFVGGAEIHLGFHYDWVKNKQHTMRRFRLALTDGAGLTPAVEKALAIAPEQRSDVQKKTIVDFYRSRVPSEFQPLSQAADAAKKSAEDFEKSLTRVMVMDDATARKTHVLFKSLYDKPMEEVSPGVPAVLNSLPSGMKNNRLALAKWLFDPANPLTARVTVNRYWQRFFGTGIVKTPDDFGVQGERPANPELLDWLAVQFRESGWNVKALHRLIVTSATYRQSSKETPALLEKDPENRLLSRGPRYRLPSFMLRDQALAAAGLLVEKVGGAPVNPYQPPGVWEEATFGEIKYAQDHGPSLYRRSLYTFWRRIVGPTEFFDNASRSQCTVRVSRTDTPMHALTLLNDETYVEAARALAQRVMEEADESPRDRIRTAYQLLLARAPKPAEQIVLLAALKHLRTEYAADPKAAEKLLAVGESKRDAKLDPVEHAAYTALCLELLNLDETVTKE